MFIEAKKYEIEMQKMMKTFLDEIDRVNKFYLKMAEELAHEFEKLSRRYLEKSFNKVAESPLSNSRIKKLSSGLMDSEENRNSILTADVKTDNQDSSERYFWSHSLVKKPNIDEQNLNKVKDELEYATNWKRAFMRIYSQLKWLNSYANINHIALLK